MAYVQGPVLWRDSELKEAPFFLSQFGVPGLPGKVDSVRPRILYSIRVFHLFYTDSFVRCVVRVDIVSTNSFETTTHYNLAFQPKVILRN